MLTKFPILVQLRLMEMSSVFNESPLKSQAKSKFLSDYVTGGNVTVYWLIFIYTMNYEINNPQGRLIQILT